MKRVIAQWARVDGGQWDSVEPASIPQNGWARLVNFLTVNGRVQRRGGSTRFSLDTPPLPTISAVIPVAKIASAPTGCADWCLVAASRIGTFALLKANRLWSGIITALPSSTIADDDMPWVLKQRNGIVYAVRRNAGRMKRIFGQSWTDAGRPAPAAAPETSAATGGGTGSIPDGVYKLAYTYYDSVTGQESNGSAQVSHTLSGGAAKFDIDTFTPPPSTVMADYYRIYMTQVGGSVLYWHSDVVVATTAVTLYSVPTNTQTLPTRCFEPYSGATWFEIWKDRGWLTDGTYVRFTDFNKVECYSALQDLSFNPGDGDTVTTLYGWGDVLVIARRRSMLILTGIDRTSFEQRIWTEMTGCVAPHSMKDCEGTLVWRGEDGFYEAGGPGAAPRNISNQTVKAALALEDISKRDCSVGEVIPELGVYIYTFAKLDGTRGGLSYNWTSRAWSELEFPQGMTFITSAFDASGSTVTLACTKANASVYAVLDGADDDGADVKAEITSRAVQGESGSFVGVEGVRMLMSATRYPLTFEVFNDGLSTGAVPSRTVTPTGDRGWSEFAINSRRATAAEVQVKISYSGKDQIWISDFALDLINHAARRKPL